MAPERFSNTPYDGAADVYSVGVMLYEMLTGHLPFVESDGNPLKIALMHVNERPRPLSELNPRVPPAVEAVVLQALAKDPCRRPTAARLGRRFAAALGRETPALFGTAAARRRLTVRGAA